MLTLGIVVLVAYIPLRLGLGYLLNRRMAVAYGQHTAQTLPHYPNDPDARAMARRAAGPLLSLVGMLLWLMPLAGCGLIVVAVS